MAYDAGTNQVVLFGGAGGSNFLGDTWTWNGTTSTWTQLSPVTSPAVREFAMMAYDAGTGLVVLFGGQNMSGVDLNDTWTWNGTTWTEKTPATSPSARDTAVMAYDPSSGLVVLFGGQGNNSLLGRHLDVEWHHLEPAVPGHESSGERVCHDGVRCQLRPGGAFWRRRQQRPLPGATPGRGMAQPGAS